MDAESPADEDRWEGGRSEGGAAPRDRPAPTSRLLLLPSPLLGPATWSPVAREVSGRGWVADVTSHAGPVRTPRDVLAGLRADLPAEPRPVLVAHSNSGLYLAALAHSAPWSEWWPEAELRAMLPDEAVRAAVRREQRRLPLDYFRHSVPSPAGWQRLPAAYLAFGDTYAEERAEAERSGWPVETLPGGTCTISSTPQPSRTPSSGWSCGWA